MFYMQIKKNRHKRKTKAISLFECKCKICEYNFCEDAFVFHHIDPKLKNFSLSSSWGVSLERYIVRIKKMCSFMLSLSC
jgi:hypothetical protein